MPFILQSVDNELIKKVSIKIISDPEPVSGLPNGEDVKFQFPPRITDDTKSANWEEKDKFTFEPYPVWMGSTPRKITIELMYIVTGREFTTAKIARTTKQLKAYFYRSVAKGSVDIPIVKIKFYDHVKGGRNATFRLTDINITHGDTIISDDEGQFPLLTKIRIGAVLTTNAGDVWDIPKLPSAPIQDWY